MTERPVLRAALTDRWLWATAFLGYALVGLAAASPPGEHVQHLMRPGALVLFLAVATFTAVGLRVTRIAPSLRSVLFDTRALALTALLVDWYYLGRIVPAGNPLEPLTIPVLGLMTLYMGLVLPIQGFVIHVLLDGPTALAEWTFFAGFAPFCYVVVSVLTRLFERQSRASDRPEVDPEQA